MASNLPVRLKIDAKGAARDVDPVAEFDPVAYTGSDPPQVKRPFVSGHRVFGCAGNGAGPEDRIAGNGFVVVAPTAGGHIAPPRGRLRLTDSGGPVYGERDLPDLDVIRDLGLPFWLAGSRAEPEAITNAVESGATGVQVGTAFAFCEESGLKPALKRRVLELSRQGRTRIFTDPVASPTGFPFKIVHLERTLSEPEMYAERDRVCDLGYLRTAYARRDGSLGWRCPSEPIDD